MIEYLQLTKEHKDRTAIISEGKSYTYQELHRASDALAARLIRDNGDLHEERIAFMIDPSYDYTVTQWAIWKAGGIAVPLCVLHPLPSIQYVLEDTGCKTIVVTEKYKSFLSDLLTQLEIETIIYESIRHNTKANVSLPDISEDRSAMILYTSGTTSLPKGVVTTHANIKAQIKTLVQAWSWQADDHILNILPLHHVHGIINVMSCALWSGACCEFLPKFDTQQVWEKLSGGDINVFMAVPTIYFKLIQHWEAQSQELKSLWSDACGSFRLMVSGSAALPVSVLEQWEEITGQRLLERYGMTEIGMGLSNLYDGERRAGHVGLPLPGVGLRLVNEEGQEVATDESGEIQIKGPSVFLEYWNKPEATSSAFTSDGWFLTGDVAILSDGYYKILGRNSVDIIKSGGYKISALEIEEVIRKYDGIKDVGIVGLPNEEWGEVVAAALVVSTSDFDIAGLKAWLKEQIPGYRLPRRYITIDDLPRNTLGKVTKKELIKQF